MSQLKVDFLTLHNDDLGEPSGYIYGAPVYERTEEEWWRLTKNRAEMLDPDVITET